MADVWDIKYLREQPFMAFGSMMNAYGRMNEGKGCTVKELEKIAEDIYNIALELTDRAYKNSISDDEEEVEIPMK